MFSPKIRKEDLTQWKKEPVTTLDTELSAASAAPGFKTARRYTVAYADADDETLLSLIDDDCDFGTLWGIVSGPVAIRVALAEERRVGMQFIGTTSARGTSVNAGFASTARNSSAAGGAQTQAFKQSTDDVYERGGWMRRDVTGWRSYVEQVRFVKLRETVVVKDGKIVARVLQKVAKSASFNLGT
jgi:hypothetical protein